MVARNSITEIRSSTVLYGIMTGRLIYIPKEIASRFRTCLGEGDLNTVKGRISDFSTVILKILSQLRAGPKTFGNLYTHSGIRFKRSYIKYCIFASNTDFLIEKSRVQESITVLQAKGAQCSLYS